MKRFFNSIGQRALQIMCSIALICVISCSNDENLEIFESVSEHDATIETVEDQLMRLTKKTRKYHNFQVAIAQGYDTNLIYIPNMGDHFSDTDLIDTNFDYLTPEVLVYIINEDGEREFVAVEYLVVKTSDTPPEGFIGEDDVWTDLGDLWALHAWIGMENPDGVFTPFNVNVTY